MQIPRFSVIRELFLITVAVLLAAGCSDDNKPVGPPQIWGWMPIGSGMNDDVDVLGVHDDRLIAGGWFTNAGGVGANRIAAWDGTNWTPLGTGVDGFMVKALADYDDQLVVGGWFSRAGGSNINAIAAWDGANWLPLGSGAASGPTFAMVYSLINYDNRLIAGGWFTSIGGVSANNVAAWDGSSWAPLGTGVANFVRGLVVYNGKLTAGTDSPRDNQIQIWDGSSWAALEETLNGPVYCLAVFGNTLIAGGEFDSAGGVSARNIAAWDGSQWTPLGAGVDSTVWGLTVFQNRLIAGGRFDTAGVVGAEKIAAWDGRSWTALGGGVDGIVVEAFTAYNHGLAIGGKFGTAGEVAANCIASWEQQ